MLPFGQGRSYGDVAQNSGGRLIATSALSRFISFDPATGRLEAEAGMPLADVHALTVPLGWHVPAVPGTQVVSLGGALANDVHGKNHHRAGTFGEHVANFELLRSDGQRLTCSPQEHADWFEATVGGLGLTGLVTKVAVQLRPLASRAVRVETVGFATIAEFLALCDAADAGFEYTVAWFDCFSYRAGRFRGLFSRANAVDAAPNEVAPRKRGPDVPFVPPVGLLHPLAMRAFNRLYEARGRRGAEKAKVTPLDAFLYPLDGIGHWNRLYGPRGFLQFQCVVPTPHAEPALTELLDAIATSREGTFLAVLKRFGTRQRRGLLSFARPGITLALDFPFRGDATLGLMQRLHAIVRDAGGAIYPAKDAVMTSQTFRAGFPDWERLLPYRDPAFDSDLWRRVTAPSRT